MSTRAWWYTPAIQILEVEVEGLKDEGHTQLQTKLRTAEIMRLLRNITVFKSSLKTKPGFPKSL